ncbi:MAG: hypothetical protein ACAH59_06920 [Pseudobdellovibrionaceae bacterium]
MKLIGFLILTFSLSACLKVTNVPSEDAQEDLGGERVAGVPQVFRVDIEDLPTPNRYAVRLPMPLASQQVFRYEKSAGPDSRLEVSAQLKEGLLYDDQVQAGKVYVYEYSAAEPLEKPVVLEATIPVDWVVPAGYSLQHDEIWDQYRRIFFNQGVVLSLNNFNLQIKADQIISDQAVIRTYPAGTRAAVGVKGLNGGQLKMVLRSGLGNLRFEFRGQEGGPGHPRRWIEVLGSNLMVGGSPGFPGGNSGSASIQISETHNLSFDVFLEEGHGGTPEPGFPKGADGSKESICIDDFRNHQCA